jgi:FeS assembly SUF system regulator
MRLSSMADYAVVILSAAVRYQGAPRLSAAVLALDTGLPLATVQKLVSKLAHAGLLRASRGAGGGLAVARPAAAISLAEVVEAVEGPIALTACVEHGRHDCSLEPDCAVRPHWTAVNAALRGALAAVSLADLAAVPDSRGPARTTEPAVLAESSGIPA